MFDCGVFVFSREEAARRMQQRGLDWPSSLGDVTGLAEESTWWTVLRQFVIETEKFKS